MKKKKTSHMGRVVNRARIVHTVSGVEISYTEDGERITREFRAPFRGGGYVREGVDNRQVCEGLYSTGRALESTCDGLMALVRREWRRRA